MVKLLKHELIALFRILLFFAAAVVVFAAIGRIILAVELAKVENGASGNMLLPLLFILLYVFAILALVVAAWGLGVSRFYKTLFSGEGYLTLSLPVSPVGIIWAKLLSSIIAMFAACAVSAFSLFIFLIGMPANFLSDLGVDVVISFQMWFEDIAAAPGLFVEELLLFILTIPVGTLVIYACISVGQLFTSHRKLMTFVIVIGLYIVYQMLALYAMTPIYEAAEKVSVHLYMWVQILLVGVIDAGSFFLIRYILRNKVNLIV